MTRAAGLKLLAAALLLAAGAAPSKETPKGAPMSLPHYEASADSPPIADPDTGLRIAFAQRAPRAVFAATAPWPLYGSYRADAATITEFGSRIDANLLVVVTHKDSKGIYTGRVLKDDPPPKNVPDSADQGGRVISSSGHFAIDLKAQCRVPAQPGKYWVTVLLGKVASPVLEFEIR
jgi:hypothetical protein